MKKIDARMDEIIRRSEEMKRQQRRRRKMVLAAIPVTLCSVLCVGVFLSSLSGGRSGETNGMSLMQQEPGAQKLPDRDGAVVPGNNLTPEMQTQSNHSMIQSVTALQIMGKGVEKAIDTPEIIADVSALLRRITQPTPNFSMDDTPDSGRGDRPGDRTYGETTAEKNQSRDFYILSLLNADGIVCQYRLNGSVLTQIATGETDFLMDDDAAALYGLLGIPME